MYRSVTVITDVSTHGFPANQKCTFYRTSVFIRQGGSNERCYQITSWEVPDQGFEALPHAWNDKLGYLC